MNINQLTSDCLVLVFQQFTLQELIDLREVCGHWKGVIEAKFELKRSLKLFGSRQDIEQYCNKLCFADLKTRDSKFLSKLKEIGLDDDLIIQSEMFDFQFCDLLAQLFANIEHLVVHFSKPDYGLWRRVPYLLKLWPDLTSLSLHGYSEQLGISTRICLAVDSLFSLTSLDISMHFTNGKSVEPPLDLPQILPQLEQFSMSLFKYKGDIRPIIQQLSPKCTKLNLECESLPFEQFRQCFLPIPSTEPDQPEIPPPATNITQLTLRCVKGNEYIPFICATFHSLRYLSILYSSLTMFKFNAELCSTLNRLRHLKELRIASIHIHVIPFVNESKNTQTPLMPVTTVKSLEISSLNFSNDKDFKFKPSSFCKTLSNMLPNLEQITIRCNRQDVIEQIQERLNTFPKLKKNKVASDYDEHRDFLGKYKNVNEEFFKKRISFE